LERIIVKLEILKEVGISGTNCCGLNGYHQEMNGKIRRFLSDIFEVSQNSIFNIKPVKKGLTNDSFTFSVKNNGKYVIRIPNEDTAGLVNRSEEVAVYNAIKELNISDDIVYIEESTGIKITKFVENAHSLDVHNQAELTLALRQLRKLHGSGVEVSHTFNLLETIQKYEELRGKCSLFKDYEVTKKNIIGLLSIVNKIKKPYCLCHVDANCDNFLITDTQDIRLIDFEYAGMQDPNLDIAMICAYSHLDRKTINTLIDTYYDGTPDEIIRCLIYAYIAIGGFIWSIWCEVKEGEYVLENQYARRQYEYAVEYFTIVYEEAKQIGLFKELYS